VITRKAAIFVLAAAIGLSVLQAAESKDGRIKLDIHEKTGHFSMYYLTDYSQQRYDAFFSHKDPSTSFLAVNYNGKIYRLGESWGFSTKLINHDGNPAMIFESSFLLVREVFSLVKTSGSPVANGIKITIYVENKGQETAAVGLRMLIDTYLGEGFGKIPFATEKQRITGETIIRGSSEEKYWVSIGTRLSLRGSIADPDSGSGKNPDFLHFANWKRLNDAIWKAPYYEGRSFNYIPYSIGDSAVCYYYEPEVLETGESFTCSILLATEEMWDKSQTLADTQAGGNNQGIPVTANETDEDADMRKLRELLHLLDQFIDGKIILSEKDLAEIDDSIIRLKARYQLR
jgi:hypothetical protein